MSTSFDWQSFLAANRPSNEPHASPLQKERMNMVITQLLPDLRSWANQQKLATIWDQDQVRFQKTVSLVTSIVAGSFQRVPRHLQAQLLARFILWFGALDHYLDHTLQHYLLQQQWSFEAKKMYVERALSER